MLVLSAIGFIWWLVNSLPGVTNAGRCCDGIDAEEDQAITSSTSFGHTQLVAAIETGHAGQVQSNHCGLLPWSAAGKWAPGPGIG